MKIPTDLLAEKNYEGSRLIEVTDPKVIELKKEITDFQPIAKPHLEIMEKLGKELDPSYTKIRELDEQKKKLKEEMQPTLDKFNVELKKMEAIEQKTNAIKNKIQPIVAKLMEGQLSEFETARQLLDRDGKLFVEVIDEIEERVKFIRMQKTKK